jgi:lipoprotein-anchoring transpeptidase ErfK/SrfK
MRRLAGLFALLAAAGCGGTAPVARHATAPRPAPKPACRTLSAVPPDEPLAAVAVGPTTAYRSPGGAALHRFARLDANGFPTVFSVLATARDRSCRPAWYHVALPIRPNGATGWVSATKVSVAPLETRIVVHVARKRLELLRAGRVVLRTPISTGAPDTPTPLGRFYVKERLLPADPHGPWGPAALGTSAFSPVLKSWVQGGPVGIHGTDDPTAIGRAVSHGCIRLPNDAMRRLYRLTPAGTPVLFERD